MLAVQSVHPSLGDQHAIRHRAILARPELPIRQRVREARRSVSHRSYASFLRITSILLQLLRADPALLVHSDQPWHLPMPQPALALAQGSTAASARLHRNLLLLPVCRLYLG